eukprot:900970-Prorocentrum_minimum.AAC.2
MHELAENPLDAAVDVEYHRYSQERGDTMEMQHMVVSLHKITRLLKVGGAPVYYYFVLRVLLCQ